MYKIDKIVPVYFEIDYITDHLESVNTLIRQVQVFIDSGTYVDNLRECYNKLVEARKHQAKACIAAIALYKTNPEYLEQLKATLFGYKQIDRTISTMEKNSGGAL